MSKQMLSFALAAAVGAIVTCLVAPSVFDGTAGEIDSSARARGMRFTPTLVDDERGFGSADRGSAASGDELTAIARRAQADVDAALRDAAAIADPGRRRQAVLLVGRVWAWTDPEAALSAAATLPPALRTELRESVSAEWANVDAQGFMRFAERSIDPVALVGGLKLLIASHPERVFEIAARLPYDTGIATNTVQLDALRVLAERDPQAALARLERVPRGPALDAMLPAVVSELARRDPDAALAWLASQNAASSQLHDAVYRGVASTDFARGYALLSGSSSASFGASLRAVLGDNDHAAEVADHLLASGTNHSIQTLNPILEYWARRDPEAAVAWMLDRRSTIPDSLITTIGRTVSTSDLKVAIDFLERLPPDVKNIWFVHVADAHAAKDAAAALDWVGEYRGEAFFEDAHSRIVLRLADADPERAATLIPSAAPAMYPMAAPRIARAWVARDPLAAAQWAQSLRGSDVESAAVNALVSGWVATDANAARDWVMRLPRGVTRDRALGTLISRAQNARLDPRPMLDEIDDAETLSSARQSAILRAANDIPLAKELLEQSVDDPRIGKWARDMLAKLEVTGY